jgi:peptidoglycan/xylan/chitin deacetylase (PgdA/CDA1 family)
MPIFVRQRLQQRRNGSVQAGPDWYLPRDILAKCSQSLSRGPYEIIHPWPAGADYSLVLTHDVETAAGMRNIQAIAEIEEELGFRSSWNVVPYKYPLDRGLLRDLRKRGFEIGIHGYNHDGKLFLSKATFHKRAEAINRALREHDCVGFRAPMVHRNLEWMQALDIEYDASCFDIDPFQAMPGGIGSIWPMITGGFVELPYTLPQDHTLFVTLGQTDTQIWRSKLNYIRQQSGMALMVSHPDYLDSDLRKSLYRDFLAWVRDAGSYWHALPCEVTQWWRERESSVLEVTHNGERIIAGPVAERGVAATVSADDHGLSIRTSRIER